MTTIDTQNAEVPAPDSSARAPASAPTETVSGSQPWYYRPLPCLPQELQLLKAPTMSAAANKEDVPALSSENISLSSIGQLASQAFKFYWEHQRSALIKLSAVTAATAVASVGLVYLNANLSTEVSKFISGSTDGTLTLACGAFSMVVMTTLATTAFGFMRQGLSLRTNQATQRIARNELTLHSELLPYEQAVGQNNCDTSQLILQNLWEKNRIPDASSNAFSGVIQVGISAAMIAGQYPLIAAALVVSALPTLVSSLNRSLERCIANLDYIVPIRLGWTRDWKLGSPKDLMPFRRLGEVEGLKQLRNEVVDMSEASDRNLDNRDITGAGAAIIIQTATVAVAGYCILAGDLAAGAGMGETLGHLGLTVSAAMGLYGLMRGASDLAKSLLILKPFYDFVEDNKLLRESHADRQIVPVMAAAPRIQLKDVSYSSDGKDILKGISIDIMPGEIVGICGPSGQGKSTLVKIIQGMLTPTSGRVLATVGDETIDIHKAQTDTWNNQIGSVAQGDAIQDGFSVGDNLRFGNPGMNSQSDDIQTKAVDINALLQHMKATRSSMVGDGWHGGIRPSGGENQKLLLGRALATDKKVVILDEPLSGIDVKDGKIIQDKILSECRERGDTVIFITHGLADLRKADRIIVIDNGKIDDQGTPQELASRAGFYRDGSMQSLKDLLAIFDQDPDIIENDLETVIRIKKHRPEAKSD